MDKREARTAMAEIRAVLTDVWNPLASPCKDEYDGFIGAVYALLKRNAADTEIAQELLRFERELETRTSTRTIKKTLAALRAIKPQL